MTSVQTALAFVDAGLPVFLTLADGRTATVLLVDVDDWYAVSKYRSRFLLSDIASIETADGMFSGMHRTGDGVRRGE
jgi:hypothetical protein